MQEIIFGAFKVSNLYLLLINYIACEFCVNACRASDILLMFGEGKIKYKFTILETHAKTITVYGVSLCTRNSYFIITTGFDCSFFSLVAKLLLSDCTLIMLWCLDK